MPDTHARQRWTIYGAIVVILIFITAMGWQYVRANRLASELAVARAEATLGASALEAQRGSFEVSRRLASDFFTQLQATVGDAPSAVRPQLTTILGQRDATITMLSRNDAQSAEVLARMFTQYRTALHGPEAAPTSPMSTGGGQPGASTSVVPPDSAPVP
ncbi:MAG: hypothetical protein ACYC2G_15270 [Gemmatimonadaceae bacterium]